MTNYFRKPDALVDAVRSILSGQPTETQEDIQRKSDVGMVKVKLPDGHMVMRRERPKIEIGKGKNESLDPVDQKALKGKHSDRKDKDIDNDGDVDSSDEYLHKRRKAVSKAMKEGVEDNPANTQHLCAKNVVHESWGEGSCIPTMHADPDEDGNIEWYDVMFDHGIEEQVSIEELKVTKAESHMHSSKKKIEESKDEYEDDDDDSDEDEKNGKKKKVSGKKDDVDVEPEMDDTKMVTEKEMTPAQEKKREEIVLSMKKEMPRFKKKYGDRAKDVMYATATKMAMKEGFELGIEKSDLIEEVELDEAKIAKKVPAKDGGHFVVLHRDTSGMKGTQDKFHMRHLKNGKVKDYGTHPSMDGALKFAKNRGIIEEVELDEAKSGTGYDLYHKDFSSAMQHAYDHAKKKHGITINPKEIDDKVATGPAKPKEGKTNSYRLKGDKGAIQVQVYNKGGSKPFELNMYKEEVELDEAISASSAYALVIQQKDGSREIVAKGSKEKMKSAAKKYGGLKQGKVFISLTGKKVGDKILGIGEEVELDEAKLSASQIAALKKAYEPMRGKKMSMDSGNKLRSIMDKVDDDKEALSQLVKADIPFVSQLAITRLITNHGMKGAEIRKMQEEVSLMSAVEEQLAKIKGNTPGDQGRRGAVEDDIERAEKKGDKKLVKKLKEDDLDEGRGRPRKDGTTGGSEDRENIQMQLRKSVSLRGLKGVEFADGNKVKVPAKVAQGVMSKINSIKDAKQKQNAVQHIAKSHKHMMDFHKGDYKDADAKRQDILKLK